MIYLVGSLRNPRVPAVAARLRDHGHLVFDDWYAAGPEADDRWRDYERGRQHSLAQALSGKAAQHVFAFDHKYLQLAETVVMLMPAGKSGHLELGWALGQGKRGYILFEEEPERYDVMWAFATGVCTKVENLIDRLRRDTWHREKQCMEQQ